MKRLCFQDRYYPSEQTIRIRACLFGCRLSLFPTVLILLTDRETVCILHRRFVRVFLIEC